MGVNMRDEMKDTDFEAFLLLPVLGAIQNCCDGVLLARIRYGTRASIIRYGSWSV